MRTDKLASMINRPDRAMVTATRTESRKGIAVLVDYKDTAGEWQSKRVEVESHDLGEIARQVNAEIDKTV